MPKKDVNRNRKNLNLAGLYAISNEFAVDENGKLRKGVLGMVEKTTPFISKPKDTKRGKPRTFVQDVTELPDACKNRILAFWDDKNNKSKSVCYLAEKSLYE